MRYGRFLREVKLLVDLIGLNLGLLLVFQWKFASWEAYYATENLQFVLGLNLAWLLAAFGNNIYDPIRLVPFEKIVNSLLNTGILYLIFVFALAGVVDTNLDRLLIFYSYFGTYLTVVFFHVLFVEVLHRYRSRGNNIKRVLIIGRDHVSEELQEIFGRKKHYGYKIVERLSFSGLEDYDTIQNHLMGLITEHHVDDIFCSFAELNQAQTYAISSFAEKNLINLHLVPDFKRLTYKSVKLGNIDYHPVLSIAHEPIEESFIRIAKRIFDICFSAGVLILASPIYLVVGVLTVTTSKGPMFFLQERVGQKGKLFKIIKFRSMRVDAEKFGAQLSSDNDPRITKWGKFMRKSRLDEIPQFYNVLRGDMSIVGPRPEREFFINQIIEEAPHYKRLHKMKPGITSLGQVYFGYAENVEEMRQRLRYDLLYLENFSFFLDFKVIFLTVMVMIQGKGK
ncbi:sugar transferase [Persicobacter diffluens]|uniref:Undecaprenyl-phosphate glucose phosphotransferase n=1 Tax=Persicobacter diffluens TaxID=981 RepID=A0AAN4VZM1_9BACT|nr:undecaprenyl-phosphate glucose phosphotransferase [Persicobacter diffluens]